MFLDIVVDLIGCRVVHMGAELRDTRPQNIAVRIGSGAHRLRLQCLLRIGRRHLAGHHGIEILLQRQFIDQHDTLLHPNTLYGAAIRVVRSATPLHFHRNLVRKICTPISSALPDGHLVCPDSDLFPVNRDPYAFVIVTSRRRIFQKHPDLIRSCLLRHETCVHLSRLHNEIRIRTAYAQFRLLQRFQTPIQLINLHLIRDLINAVILYLQFLCRDTKQPSVDFFPALLCLHNPSVPESQIRHLFPLRRLIQRIPGKRRLKYGLMIKTIQRAVLVFHHPHTSQIMILRQNFHNGQKRTALHVDL